MTQTIAEAEKFCANPTDQMGCANDDTNAASEVATNLSNNIQKKRLDDDPNRVSELHEEVTDSRNANNGHMCHTFLHGHDCEHAARFRGTTLHAFPKVIALSSLRTVIETSQAI